MEKRVYNFSAGPSMLPLSVLKEVQEDLLNYKGSGQSVMEMSHRSKEFEGIIKAAEKNLRTLMKVPDNYKVLFLQGGATLQFSMIPLNILKKSKKADYVVTGSWAEKAIKEAEKFGDIKVAASSKDKNYTYIPVLTREDFRKDADYVHITWNNTIFGTAYKEVPDTGGIPLVTDMSSSILSEEIRVEDFAIIYAGAQKNIGPAGLTLVIIREDFIGLADKNLPVYLDYNTHTEGESMYNTPPCFAIYIAGEVFKDLLNMGGLKEISRRNKAKADKLYSYIDKSKLFKCPVVIKDRSLMNVVFVTGSEDLDKEFIKKAKEEGLINLGGHRSIGGMRASIYNGMPAEGVDHLISFMEKFEKDNV